MFVTSLHALSLLLLLQASGSTGIEVLDNLQSLLFSGDKTANIFITLSNGPEEILAGLAKQTFGSRADQVTSVVEALQNHTSVTQKAVLDLIQGFAASSPTPIKITPFWISNQIYIQGANKFILVLLQALGPIIKFIGVEKWADLIPTLPAQPTTTQAANKENVTWGLHKIQAVDAWALVAGSNAEPIVIGSIDSGVRGTHETLRDNFLGQYGWFDPKEKTAFPNDQHGHGTHTIATIVGSNRIGVAPRSKWMACKGCQSGRCAQSDILACGQFMMCPTLADGSSPNCAKAPRLINNSWGGPGGDGFYKNMIASWHTAGIIPIFANGNEGPWCATSGSPGDYAEVISVGSTNVKNGLSAFSSRGPASAGFMRLGGITKPDLSAPGEGILSAWNDADNGYKTISGTSMAAPHVAGLVALMFEANPGLTYEQVKQYLLAGCTSAELSRPFPTCEFQLFRYKFPNNEYGQGIINARTSVSAALSSRAA